MHWDLGVAAFRYLPGQFVAVRVPLAELGDDNTRHEKPGSHRRQWQDGTPPQAGHHADPGGDPESRHPGEAMAYTQVEGVGQGTGQAEQPDPAQRSQAPQGPGEKTRQRGDQEPHRDLGDAT